MFIIISLRILKIGIVDLGIVDGMRVTVVIPRLGSVGAGAEHLKPVRF